MSGYDFFSGFLGSLGQQMQQKKQQKLAVEEEDRQFQRAMSREEVLARHRERFAIAAEERRQQAQPPEAFQELVDGQLMGGLRTWNPKKKAYELYGEMTPVAPSVADTRNVDGNVVQYMSDGSHRVLGKSDAGVRASASVDVAKIRASKPAESAPKKDPLAAESRRVTRAAVRDATSDDEAKRRNIFKAYRLDPETATVDQLRKAVDDDIRGIKPEPKSDMPVVTPELQKKYDQVFANKLAEQKGEVPKAAEQAQTYTEFADDIASARKRYAGGDDATEDEIIEALIYEGKLRRNSDGRLSKN